MIAAHCIAGAHDHDRFAANVQPPAMQSCGLAVTGYAKAHPANGLPAMQRLPLAACGGAATRLSEPAGRMDAGGMPTERSGRDQAWNPGAPPPIARPGKTASAVDLGWAEDFGPVRPVASSARGTSRLQPNGSPRRRY